MSPSKDGKEEVVVEPSDEAVEEVGNVFIYYFIFCWKYSTG